MFSVIKVQYLAHRERVQYNVSVFEDSISSVYKKKRKLYIMFDNTSHIRDNHLKLSVYLDWTVIVSVVGGEPIPKILEVGTIRPEQ